MSRFDSRDSIVNHCVIGAVFSVCICFVGNLCEFFKCVLKVCCVWGCAIVWHFSRLWSNVVHYGASLHYIT